MSQLTDALAMNEQRRRATEERRYNADQIYAARLAALDDELWELRGKCPHPEKVRGAVTVTEAGGVAKKRSICSLCGMVFHGDRYGD